MATIPTVTPATPMSSSIHWNPIATEVNEINALTWEGTTIDALAAAAEIGYRDGARYNRTTTQSIPNITMTTVVFGANRFESGVSEASGVFTLTIGGRWLFGANIGWSNTTGTFRYIRFLLNGTTDIHRSNSTPATTQGATSLYDFADSDTITCQVFQDSGAAQNITVNANFTPEVWMYRLGS